MATETLTFASGREFEASEAHDEVLRTRPNLPSLDRGDLYRMTPAEIHPIRSTLNPDTVDAYFSKY